MSNNPSYAHWLGCDWRIDLSETQSFLEKLCPNWLVVDHYAIDSRWESAVRPLVSRIMVIDDLADRLHDCDVLLDHNLYENMNSRYPEKVPTHCRIIAGPRYALLRDEFKRIHKEAKPCSGQAKRLFVFFGGIDANNYTLRTIELLTSLGILNLYVDVVVGTHHPYRVPIQSNCIKHGFNYHLQTSEMAELMKKADLAIGADGTTTWERNCCLLPSVAITTAENKISPIKEVEKLGLVRYFGHTWEDASPV